MISKLTNKVLLCAIFCALSAITPVYAQEPAVKAQPAPKALEKLTEIEHVKLKLNIETQKRIQAQYDAALQAAISQFREQAATRQLINEAEQAAAEANALLEKAFADHKVDKATNRINPDTGEFTPVPSADKDKK